MTDLFGFERCRVDAKLIPDRCSREGIVVREARNALFGHCYVVQLRWLDRDGNCWIYAPVEKVVSIENRKRQKKKGGVN